eukprot:Clim_evm5s10 gene=Clim_evmTU5s10
MEPSYKPLAIAFPNAIYDFADHQVVAQRHLVNSFTTQPFKELVTRMWDVETVEIITAPKTVLENNGDTLCANFFYDYSKAISQSTTTSSSKQVSSDTKISDEIDLSESAGLKFALSEQISATIKQSVSESVGLSYTTGKSHTNTTTTTVTWGSTPTVLPNSILNITVWTAQVTADIYITGDALYPGNTTGIQTWIQGDGVEQLAPYDKVPVLESSSQIATLDQIKNVAKIAMNLIDAKWSDTFLNTLISSSVGGKVDSLAGDTAVVEIWVCDMDSVPYLTCDKTLSKLFPPQIKTCPGNRRTVLDHSGSFEESLVMSLLPHDRCYSMVPVQGYDNRWYIQKHNACNTGGSAS